MSWLRPDRVFGRNYDFTRLIDTRRWGSTPQTTSPFQIVCDIDKTYLETHFESFMQMIRIAMEDATQKVTVEGASDVLIAARWGIRSDVREGFPRPLHFVSASPPQMREVLEAKLTLDGLDWDSDTFKNQAYNIRKGRMDQLRQHIPYKSLAILSTLLAAPKDTTFFFIGDNAEFDGYIYTGLALFAAGRLSPTGYSKYLEASGVEAKVASDFIARIHNRPDVQVGGIFIRKAPGYKQSLCPPLTDPIFWFDHFFEAGLAFTRAGLIAPEHLWDLARSFHNRYGLKRRELYRSLDELRVTSLDDHLIAVIKSVQEKLRVGEAEAEVRVNPFMQADLTAYQALTENEILAAARQWVKLIER